MAWLTLRTIGYAAWIGCIWLLYANELTKTANIIAAPIVYWGIKSFMYGYADHVAIRTAHEIERRGLNK